MFSVLTLWVHRCHMFYPQRVVDINDGKPKWTKLDKESELCEEYEPNPDKRRKIEKDIKDDDK